MRHFVLLLLVLGLALGQYSSKPNNHNEQNHRNYHDHQEHKNQQTNEAGPHFGFPSHNSDGNYIHPSCQSRPTSYKGKTIYYQLVIDFAYGAPDGLPRRVIAINGQYPGPTIEGIQGDTVVIDVVNKLDRSMAIHWHGMFQTGTPDMDGAAFVGECPTLPGHTKTYKFRLQQHGTYWYHSHFMNEIVDGCKGALIVHRAPGDPEPYDYEEDVIVELSDWYHTESDVLWQNLISPPPGVVVTGPPHPNSVLINGIGQIDACYTGDADCSYNVIEASPHGYTRVRVIATNAYLPVIVSIDDHALIITEVDGVPVMWRDTWPEDVNAGRYTGYVTHLRINVAQRYSFLAVPLNGRKPRAGDKFWFRAVLDGGQFAGGATTGLGGVSPTYGGYNGLFSSPGTAILANAQIRHRQNFNQKGQRFPAQYNGPSTRPNGVMFDNHQNLQWRNDWYRPGPSNQGPSRNHYHKRNVEQQNGAPANATAPATLAEADGVILSLAIFSYGKSNGFPNTEDATYDDASTLSSMPCPECLPCNDLHPIHNLSPPTPDYAIHLDIDFFKDPTAGFGHFNNISCLVEKWGSSAMSLIRAGITIPKSCLTYEIEDGDNVLLIIDNHDRGEHPIHLHGHLFWVLSQGEPGVGNYNADNASFPQWNWNNPLYRDTVTVNPSSYVIIQFVADNWGPWFMHCHIDWHLMAGLAIIFNESPLKTQKEFGTTKYPESCVYVAPPLRDTTIHNAGQTYASGPYPHLINRYPSVTPDY